MLFVYISFLLACGIVSSTPEWDHTPEERARILGPFANIDVGMDFPCPGVTPSPTIPTSVHALRPGDIKYVAAIGDSLTAASGAGAGSVFGLFTEYRGFSWSIGGSETLDTVVTLPNILRKINADLYGYSTGNGNQDSSNAHFNAARAGAVSIEMADQANLLVDRMIKSLGQTEFESAWKLVTLFIGGNDLCAYCKDETYYSPTAFRDNVKAALDVLKARMPRTLVNYVTVLNVAELEDLHEGLTCQFAQFLLCDCAINKNTREIVRAANFEYQRLSNALIGSGIYDDKDDFTVVTQSFMEHMKVPVKPDGLPDFSYFTHDCFHFSKKGHGAAAIELWNNMMQPVGQKTTVWNLADTLHCPSEADGFIYTSKNSKQ